MKDKELTDKQQQAAFYIVSGLSFSEIGDKLAVSSRTIFRWVRISAVQLEIRSLRRTTLEHSTNKLMRLTDKAIDTLEKLLDCSNPAARCRAAVSILDRNQSSIEFYEYSQRLEAIEQRFDEHK